MRRLYPSGAVLPVLNPDGHVPSRIFHYLYLTLSGTKTSLAGYYLRNGASFTVLSRTTLAPSLASSWLRARFKYADVQIGDKIDRVGIQAIVWKDPWQLSNLLKKGSSIYIRHYDHIGMKSDILADISHGHGSFFPGSIRMDNIYAMFHTASRATCLSNQIKRTARIMLCLR